MRIIDPSLSRGLHHFLRLVPLPSSPLPATVSAACSLPACTLAAAGAQWTGIVTQVCDDASLCGARLFQNAAAGTHASGSATLLESGNKTITYDHPVLILTSADSDRDAAEREGGGGGLRAIRPTGQVGGGDDLPAPTRTRALTTRAALLPCWAQRQCAGGPPFLADLPVKSCRALTTRAALLPCWAQRHRTPTLAWGPPFRAPLTLSHPPPVMFNRHAWLSCWPAQDRAILPPPCTLSLCQSQTSPPHPHPRPVRLQVHTQALHSTHGGGCPGVTRRQGGPLGCWLVPHGRKLVVP